MTRNALWSRWKQFARRAAQAQAHVLFFLLYYVLVAPLGILRRGRVEGFTSRPRTTPPRWRTRGDAPASLDSVTRQF